MAGDKPKPLTRAEWEAWKSGRAMPADDMDALDRRIDATIDALFRYRDRTRGMFTVDKDGRVCQDTAEDIAREEGLE